MTVLCYHAVDPDWTSSLSVSPAQFRRQIDWLIRHRRVVPLDEAVYRLRDGGTVADQRCALTFDDGFASVAAHALPVLARWKVPATVFVVSKTLLDDPGEVDWVLDSDLAGYSPRPLCRDEVAELAAAGVDIQAHSHTHRTLTELSDAECEQDLRDCRQLLEEVVRRKVTMLAYPGGRHDERVRGCARRAGFAVAFGDAGPRLRSDPYAVERSSVYGQDSFAVFRAKMSRTYLPFRTSSAFPLVKPTVSRVRRVISTSLG